MLGTRDLLALRGVIADDPFRAVHVMPTVATGDDFQAQFAVRGQGPAHIGIALDGVDTSLLFHTVRGLDDTGSIALINSDILDSATLQSGAHFQRLGSHTGARLDFTTREPSRDRLAARVALGATAATTVWEGPLGDGSRGGWWPRAGATSTGCCERSIRASRGPSASPTSKASCHSRPRRVTRFRRP